MINNVAAALGLIGTKTAQFALKQWVLGSPPLSWGPEMTAAFIVIDWPAEDLIHAVVDRIDAGEDEDGHMVLSASALVAKVHRQLRAPQNDTAPFGATAFQADDDERETRETTPACRRVETHISGRLAELHEAEQRTFAPIHNSTEEQTSTVWSEMNPEVREAWIGHHLQLDGKAHAWEAQKGQWYQEHVYEARDALRREHLVRHPFYSEYDEQQHQESVVSYLRAAKNVASPANVAHVCNWLRHRDESIALEAADAAQWHEHDVAEEIILRALRDELELPPEGEPRRRRPRVAHKLLQSMLKWKKVRENTVSETVRHLLRLPAYHHHEGEICTTACVAGCNPHTRARCRKSCKERCKDDKEIARLLKKLAHRSSSHPKRHDLKEHVRRHYYEAHESHHMIAQEVHGAGPHKPYEYEDENGHVARHKRELVERAEERRRMAQQEAAEAEAAHTFAAEAKERARAAYVAKVQRRLKAEMELVRKETVAPEEARNTGTERHGVASDGEGERPEVFAQVPATTAATNAGVPPQFATFVMSSLPQRIQPAVTHDASSSAHRRSNISSPSNPKRFSNATSTGTSVNATSSTRLSVDYAVVHVPQLSREATGHGGTIRVQLKVERYAEQFRRLLQARAEHRQALQDQNERLWSVNRVRRLQHQQLARQQRLGLNTATLDSRRHRRVLDDGDTCQIEICEGFMDCQQDSCPQILISSQGQEANNGFIADVKSHWEDNTVLFNHKAGDESLGTAYTPLPAFADFIVAPEFEGSVVFGQDGNHIVMSAEIVWSDGIALGHDLVTIEGRPEGDEPGMRLSLQWTVPQFGGPPNAMTMMVDGGLKLNTEAVPMPSFRMEGELVFEGTSRLSIYTIEGWAPVEAIAFIFQLPTMRGTLELTDRGSVSMHAETEQALSFNIAGADLLELKDVVVVVDVEEYVPEIDQEEVPLLTVGVSGNLQVLGNDGFAASILGSIAIETGTMTLELSHEGGWAPIPSIAHIIRTPEFTGSVSIGGENQPHLAVAATVTWATSIPLGTEMIKIVGHPSTGASGLKLGVEVTQEEKGGEKEWVLSLEAGVKLFGDHARAPPVVGFIGNVNQEKHVNVQFETADMWTPLAGIIVSCHLPADQHTRLQSLRAPLRLTLSNQGHSELIFTPLPVNVLRLCRMGSRFHAFPDSCPLRMGNCRSPPRRSRSPLWH